MYHQSRGDRRSLLCTGQAVGYHADAKIVSGLTVLTAFVRAIGRWDEDVLIIALARHKEDSSAGGAVLYGLRKLERWEAASVRCPLSDPCERESLATSVWVWTKRMVPSVPVHKGIVAHAQLSCTRFLWTCILISCDRGTVRGPRDVLQSIAFEIVSSTRTTCSQKSSKPARMRQGQIIFRCFVVQ